jgi:hypothetical protein
MDHRRRVNPKHKVGLLVVEEVAVRAALAVQRLKRREPHAARVALDRLEAGALRAARVAAGVVAAEAAADRKPRAEDTVVCVQPSRQQQQFGQPGHFMRGHFGHCGHFSQSLQQGVQQQQAGRQEDR